MYDIGIYPDKKFSEDIKVFGNFLSDRKHFTFSKFADGEWYVLEDRQLDNKEFIYQKNNQYTEQKKLLTESFKYQHDQYYVGISCRCCCGSAFEKMKSFSEQPKERLTWANLWVNANYQYYLDNIVPLFNNYNVALVANENSNIENLPFAVKKFFPVGHNAWLRDIIKLEELIEFSRDKKDWLFLFCCGPFGNILAYKLLENNANNTYLDIGSTLNPFLGKVGKHRFYFDKHKKMKPCVWR